MHDFQINKIAGYAVSDVSEVKTYSAYLDDAGLELLIDVYDSGEVGEYRYRVGARLADQDVVRQLGDQLPKELCYGNGGPTPEIALGMSHWDGLKKVIQILK